MYLYILFKLILLLSTKQQQQPQHHDQEHKNNDSNNKWTHNFDIPFRLICLGSLALRRNVAGYRYNGRQCNQIAMLSYNVLEKEYRKKWIDSRKIRSKALVSH